MKYWHNRYYWKKKEIDKEMKNPMSLRARNERIVFWRLETITILKQREMK